MIHQFKKRALFKRDRFKLSVCGKHQGVGCAGIPKRPVFFMTWGLLMLSLIPSPVLSCEKFPFVSKKKWESYPKWEGYYANCDNGYAITIPENFTARSTPPPAPQHGVGIWLSEAPKGYIWVDGSFNTLEWESLEQAVTWHIDRRHEDARELLSVQKFHIKLDTLPAIRCVIRYSCPDSTMMIDDYFLALDRGMVYTVALSSAESKYEDYKKILEDFASTFQVKEFSCK